MIRRGLIKSWNGTSNPEMFKGMLHTQPLTFCFMAVSTYVPHLLYSTVLTSLSLHLLFHKKQSEVDRSHLTAQISILESLTQQLRSGQDVADGEIERLYKLAKTHDDSYVDGTGVERQKVGWRDVFLGRKTSEVVEGENVRTKS